MRSDEIVSPEKLRELAQAYSRESEAEANWDADTAEKEVIVVAFAFVAFCVIGPVVLFTVLR